MPVLFLAFVILAVSGQQTWGADKTEKNLPVKGMVTLVDLGAKKYVPCKMMAPILAKLEKDYKGKAAIILIDVWENPDPAKRFCFNSA